MHDHTLLPCPFCGGTKQWVMGPTCTRKTPYNERDRAFPIVRCLGCITDVSGKDWDASCQSAVDNWNTRADTALQDRVTALEEALKPSAETKAAYIGEFSFSFPEFDDEGNDRMRSINVPWTTIKEIMAAISARSLLDGSK